MTLDQLIKSKFDERYRRTMEDIINGLPDYPSYRFCTGQLRGMYDFMADIKDLVKDPDSANDEDE